MMDRLWEKLKKYGASGALPMHMPGHKRNVDAFPWLAELGGGLDITEIHGFDDLNAPEGLFWGLEYRMARLWGAEESIALVNGSTVGVLAACLAALEGGGELLLCRGSHRSVYHAAQLAGARERYLVPKMDALCGAWLSVTPEEVAEALAETPDVRLVCVVSPTYEGVISDIAGIAEVCHAHGVPLLVDEAHGAHLGLAGFPKSAVACGADLTVQSLHKTLPSLTQTAALHIRGGLVDPRKVRRFVGMLQSSSPSYLLSASIDACVDYLEREGEAAARQWLTALDAFYESVRGLRRLRIWRGGFQHDPSKIVISTTGSNIEGQELMELLRTGYAIELEMATRSYALAMTGMGDDGASLARLSDALLAIDAALLPAPMTEIPSFALPEKAMETREALSAEGEIVELSDANRRVSAEYVWAYPPGVPLLVPGEVVNDRIIEAIRTGVNVHSTNALAPNRIFCVRKT